MPPEMQVCLSIILIKRMVMSRVKDPAKGLAAKHCSSAPSPSRRG